MFILLIILIILQQFPIVFESYYDEIRLLIYFLFSLLIIYNLATLKKALQYKLFFMFLIVVVYSIPLSIISHNNLLLDLGIPFFVVLISLGTRFNDEELKRILAFYVIGVTIMGLVIVFYYVNGFLITSTYAIPAKNQRGPMIGYATLLSIISIFKGKFPTTGFLNKYFNLVLLSINFLVILTFRNRASILALALCIFLILLSTIEYKQSIDKWFIIFFVLSIFIILTTFGLLDNLYIFIWDSITLNYDITNLESISAGRMDTYIEALRFSFQQPVAGEIISNSGLIGIPHNYILYNWVNYGILLSLPLTIFYLYLWHFSIRNIIKNIKNSLPVWLLLFSLIVSIFEYTYPYGPGVSQLFMWFLLGQFLVRNKHYN